MTILPGESPCYRCLFPEPPPPGAVPSCQEGGILGAVAGILGVLQANEVLKFILNTGELLTGKLLIFNALDSTFRMVKVPKDNDCLVCSDHPKITKLIDYQEFCSLKSKRDCQMKP
jgi:adenylyltransferase/sulfurtransferase